MSEASFKHRELEARGCNARVVIWSQNSSLANRLSQSRFMLIILRAFDIDLA